MPTVLTPPHGQEGNREPPGTELGSPKSHSHTGPWSPIGALRHMRAPAQTCGNFGHFAHGPRNPRNPFLSNFRQLQCHKSVTEWHDFRDESESTCFGSQSDVT